MHKNNIYYLLRLQDYHLIIKGRVKSLVDNRREIYYNLSQFQYTWNKKKDENKNTPIKLFRLRDLYFSQTESYVMLSLLGSYNLGLWTRVKTSTGYELKRMYNNTTHTHERKLKYGTYTP